MCMLLRVFNTVITRPAPIMVEILPIILSRISQILPIILLIITYYSHKILLTILHARAGNSGVR